jgi:hypothetical protein
MPRNMAPHTVSLDLDSRWTGVSYAVGLCTPGKGLRGWVLPRACLDTVVQRVVISAADRKRNAIFQNVTNDFTNWTIMQKLEIQNVMKIHNVFSVLNLLIFLN